jgi:hypothetical protein
MMLKDGAVKECCTGERTTHVRQRPPRRHQDLRGLAEDAPVDPGSILLHPGAAGAGALPGDTVFTMNADGSGVQAASVAAAQGGIAFDKNSIANGVVAGVGVWALVKILGKIFSVALLALAFGLLATPSAFADEDYLGSIVSAGATVNNSTTASPFTIQAGSDITIQCSAAFYYVTSSSAAVTATSTGTQVPDANALFDIALSAGRLYIAILPVAGGATTCKVYKTFRRPVKVIVVSG